MADRRIEGVHRQIGTLYRVGRLGGEPDAELLDRFLAGPEAAAEAAFASLVERHGPMVLRISRRLLPDPNDAEDVAQAAFLLLARRAGAIRRRDSVASWLHGVTLRVSKKARSSASRRRLLERRAVEHSPRPPSAPEPGDALESRWADLHAELDRLPDALRAPLVLCYLEGRTNEQAADALRVPLRTLRRRLAQGRDRLRSRLCRADAAPLVAALAEPPRLPAAPAPWLDHTVRSALAFASGRLAAAPAASAIAVSLAQEVTRTMLRAQLLRSVAAAALLLGALGTGLGTIPLVLAGQDAPPEAPPLPPSQQPEEQEQAPSFAEVPDAIRPGDFLRPPLPGWVTDRPRTGPGRSTTLRITAAESGAPIPSARVRVWKALDDEWRITDAGGLITVEHSTGPADSNFSVDTWADGYAMQRHSFGEKPGEEIPEEATIAHQPGESLGGVVRDEQGRPVPGAVVYLWSHNYSKKDPAELLYDLPAVTGPDGRWRTGGAPETTGEILGIYITHPDYISDREYVAGREKPPIDQLRAGTAVSVLKKGAYVEGRVLDADGDPVPGALVLSTDRPDHLFSSVRDFAAVTDPDGRYRTGQLAPGTWHLVAQAPGHAPAATELEIGTAIPSVDLTLGRPRTLAVRVLDQDGAPIEGVFVNFDTWFAPPAYRCLSTFFWTDAEGRASWAGAPDDPMLVDASVNGYFGKLHDRVEPTDEEVVYTLGKSLSISGRVRDAETGEEIERAEVEVGAVDPDTGEVGQWTTKPDRIEYQWWVSDGRLNVNIPVEAESYKIRITTPGYAPFVSRAFRSDEVRVVDYAVSLQPPDEGGPVATVRFPDGEPLADARVLIARRDHGVSLRNGEADERYANINPGRPFRTGPDGSFPIPPADQPYVAVVVGDRGYAIANSEQLVESGEIQARPFARVEGRFLIGDRPGANISLNLGGSIQDPSTLRISIRSSHRTTTGADGRFAFDRVIPTEDLSIARWDEDDTPGRVLSLGEPVRVEPGETVRITSGGVGRPVVGRVAPPEDWNEPVDFTKQASATVLSDQPNAPYPPELFRGKTTLEGGYWSEWSREWLESPAGRTFGDAHRSVSVTLFPDGSFRVDDVPPGEYRLVVVAGEEEFKPSRGPFSPISRTFTVPEVPGGYSPEPIDFGVLRLRRRTIIEVGQDAPKARVTTVEGDVLDIPGDFRGRYLLLDFGTPANDQSRLSIARANGLHEQFGEDDRVSMLSLIVAEDDAETRSFVAAKGQPWPQAILGPLPNPVAEAYGVEDSSMLWGGRLPGFVLIGPDGTILSLDTYGRELAPILSEALGQ
ncbi:sigma-70 family RNA polymerase sigma factor [Tautonia plasticadhaerens]|uniref:ECF RNA polymerase sigma factor SigE n=1 Tax=Tautonia plasticadhaerens TaxID=2527974 RepID=A0A518H2R1_9BACT|nr:sigma-70 family RNA polymerase sigma factor [Tautonia plasticadhaerens]QDV35107.1 ECF RNA polymerase sigma factor SigE [Tautonia plasticadhaerens]